MQYARAGDGADEDDRPASAAGDHVARAGFGDEEGAGEVGIDENAKFFFIVIFGFEVGVDNAGAVYEDVWGAEVLGNFGYGGNHSVGVADIDFVELDGDFGGGVEFGCSCVADGSVEVYERDGGGPGFSEGLGHVPAQTAGAAMIERKA